MQLIQVNQQLEELYFSCSASKYVSHYPIQCRYEKLLKECASIDFTTESNEQVTDHHALKTKLETELERLKKANEKLIRGIDFEKECTALVEANDVVNLEGLTYIGEYFGIGPGPRGKDVVGGLEFVREQYRTKPSRRTHENQMGLDKLCDLLSDPRLPVPETNFCLFQNIRERMQAIIKADAPNDLMAHVFYADQDTINFSLRLAASTDTSIECLLFLLSRSAPSAEMVTTNILTPGQPSGQIALHRAILSKKTMPISVLMDRLSNPSNDILRQLLVRDKRNLSPIDLISKIEDRFIQDCAIQAIRNALENYQSIPEVKLSSEQLSSVEKALHNVNLQPKTIYGFRVS